MQVKSLVSSLVVAATVLSVSAVAFAQTPKPSPSASPAGKMGKMAPAKTGKMTKGKMGKMDKTKMGKGKMAPSKTGKMTKGKMAPSPAPSAKP